MKKAYEILIPKGTTVVNELDELVTLADDVRTEAVRHGEEDWKYTLRGDGTPEDTWYAPVHYCHVLTAYIEGGEKMDGFTAFLVAIGITGAFGGIISICLWIDHKNGLW